jgi:tetratricopeptide (TPR) repeat protein
MKKSLLILFLLSLVFSSSAQNNESLWDEGNKAYAEGRYAEATAAYDSILRSGKQSAMLYYNLGNSYFKQGKIGLALVNLYRAERLAPDNEDIKYNIKIVSTYVQDKIEQVPEFFVNRWVRTLRTALSSNLWAAISLATLTIALIGVIVYLFGQRIGLRKVGFFCGVFGLIIFVVSFEFAIKSRNEIIKPTHAIIVNSAVAVKASPDNGSKDVFVLHEGTSVRVVRTLDKWSEITIADGNKGWLNSNSYQLID